MDAATRARRAVLAAGTSWGSGAGDSGPRGRVPHKDTLSGIRGRRGRGRCARASGRGPSAHPLPVPGAEGGPEVGGGGGGETGRAEAGKTRGPGEDEGPAAGSSAPLQGRGEAILPPGPSQGPGGPARPRPSVVSSPPNHPHPSGTGRGGCPLPDAPAGQPARSPGGVQRGREGRAGWCGEGAGPRPRLPRGSGVRGLRGGAAGAGAQAAAGPWRRRDRGRGARRGEDGERAGSRYLYWAAAAAAAAPLWVNPK